MQTCNVRKYYESTDYGIKDKNQPPFFDHAGFRFANLENVDLKFAIKTYSSCRKYKSFSKAFISDTSKH